MLSHTPSVLLGLIYPENINNKTFKMTSVTHTDRYWSLVAMVANGCQGELYGCFHFIPVNTLENSCKKHLYKCCKVWVCPWIWCQMEKYAMGQTCPILRSNIRLRRLDNKCVGNILIHALTDAHCCLLRPDMALSYG